MSDALSDIAKRDKEEKLFNNAILLIAKRIDLQTRHIKDRGDWESEISDYLEIVSDNIVDELELMWIDNGGSPP